jgi:hypothetical protein
MRSQVTCQVKKDMNTLQFLANYPCVPAIAIHISRIFKRISDLSSLMRFVTDQATHTLAGPLNCGGGILSSLAWVRAGRAERLSHSTQAGNTGGESAADPLGAAPARLDEQWM